MKLWRVELLGELRVIGPDRAVTRFRTRQTGALLAYLALFPDRPHPRDALADRFWPDADPDAARHLLYFLCLAEEAEPELRGPEQGRWLHRLEAERDNLRAALDQSARGEEVEAGLRLAVALRWFWSMRGYLVEGRERVASLLALPQASARTAARARALNAANSVDAEIGSAQNQEALSICRDLGDRRGIATSLGNLGDGASRLGRTDEARTFYEEALAIWHALGDRHGISDMLNNLASEALDRGDRATARALYGESLAIAREIGDRLRIGFLLNNQACLAKDEGDYQTARHLHEEALGLMQELGYTGAVANSLRNLGWVALARGDCSEAWRLHEESLALWRTLGYRWQAAESLCVLGTMAREEQCWDTARAHYAEALTIWHELGDRRGASCLEQWAWLAAARQQPLRAARLFGAADALLEGVPAHRPPWDEVGHARYEALARTALGEEAFAAAWEAGRAMTLEEAVALALEELDG